MPSAQIPYLPSISQLGAGIYGNRNQPGLAAAQGFPQSPHMIKTSNIQDSSRTSDGKRSFPLGDVQEACLLRYYIEEISHWVSLTSPHSRLPLLMLKSSTCATIAATFTWSCLQEPEITLIF
jgi:hypothetical protein